MPSIPRTLPSRWKCSGQGQRSPCGTRPSSCPLNVRPPMPSRGKPRPPRPLTVSGRSEPCSSLAGSVLLITVWLGPLLILHTHHGSSPSWPAGRILSMLVNIGVPASHPSRGQDRHVPWTHPLGCLQGNARSARPISSSSRYPCQVVGPGPTPLHKPLGICHP